VGVGYTLYLVPKSGAFWSIIYYILYRAGSQGTICQEKNFGSLTKKVALFRVDIYGKKREKHRSVFWGCWQEKEKHLLSQVLVVDDTGIEVREWCVFACRQVLFCAITDENCENRC